VKAVSRINITVYCLVKSDDGGRRGIGASGDSPCNDIPGVHQNVNALETLEDQIKAVSLAFQTGGSGDGVGFQSEGGCRML
jgi:hypothetical protein